MTDPAPSPSAPGSASHPARIGFVLRLGRALHAYGTPAHRLEDTLARVADRLGVPGQFFATPTSIFASFGEVEHQRTHLLRLEPGDTDLARLADADAIGAAVLAGRLAPEQGSVRIESVVAAPPRYGAAATVLGFGLASAAAARFLGGGAREVSVAALVGLATGSLAIGAARTSGLRRVFEPLAACVGAALATAAGAWLGGYAASIAMLAGIIVLVPGLTLAVAMAELSARHLVAGTARLAGAAGVFLTIAFGVAVGTRLGALLARPPAPAPPAALPVWTEAAALLVAPLALTVLLRARARDAPGIVAVGIAAFFAGRLGADVLGPELGIVAGSFVAAVASNLLARALDQPAAITLVPALLLIVPGSVGFRSLAALLDRQTVSGLETAFRMTIMLAALVVGLFSAQIVAPPRRWSE